MCLRLSRKENLLLLPFMWSPNILPTAEKFIVKDAECFRLFQTFLIIVEQKYCFSGRRVREFESLGYLLKLIFKRWKLPFFREIHGYYSNFAILSGKFCQNCSSCFSLNCCLSDTVTSVSKSSETTWWICTYVCVFQPVISVRIECGVMQS